MQRITVELDDGERQMVLLALANLALLRPGFDYMLGQMAVKLERTGDDLYGTFKVHNMQPLPAP
jgi:hypothetical protein